MRDQRSLLDSGGKCSLRDSRRKRRLLDGAAQVGVHDDLAVVTQVDRLQLVELLAPLLQVRLIDLVAIEIIRRSQVHQHRARRIVGQNLDVVGIGEIDFTQFLRVVRAAGVELADQVVVDLHDRAARGYAAPLD